MAVVNYSDLFDFDGYEGALNKLISKKDAFAKNVLKLNKQIETSYDTHIAKIKEIATLTSRISFNDKNAAKQLEQYAKIADKYIDQAAKQKEVTERLNSVVKANEDSIKGLREELRKLKGEYDSLDPKQVNYNQKQAELASRAKDVTALITTQTRVLNQAVKSANDTANSYAELSRKTGDLKAQLRNMPDAFNSTTGAINKNNQAAVALQRQIAQNDKALKAMDVTMGNHQRNVGNYTSALTGLGSTAMRALPAVLGIGSAFQAITASIGAIDRMERLRLSLEAASGSTKAFIERQRVIRSLANETGQDIETLTSSYVKFTAATQGSILQGDRADKIFQSFSRSFSALGADSQKAGRGLLAIEQMISKGTVGAEELRQQLGDALPGSINLFMEAYKKVHNMNDLTVDQFMDLMKKGKVVASEILPAVAERLEEMYGSKAQRNLQTISGSWTNVTNQVKFFLESLNQDSVISKFFSSINNGFANTLKGVTRLVQSEGWKEVARMFLLGTKNEFKIKTDISAEAQGKVDKFHSLNANERGKMLSEEIKLYNDLTKEIEKFNAEGKNVIYASSERTKKTIELNAKIKEQKNLINELSAATQVLSSKDIANATAKKRDITIKGDKKKTKKVDTEFEKLVKQADKLRDILIDDALQDIQSGKAVSLPKETLDKWDTLYLKVLAVAKATGTDIPDNLEKLNNKLHPLPKLIVPKKEKQVKPKKQDNGVDLDKSGYMQLIAGQQEETTLLAAMLDTGTLRRLGDEYKAELASILQEIQQLERDGRNEEAAIARRNFQEKKRLAEEEVRLRKMVRDESIRLAADVVNAVFEINAAFREQEIEANTKQMEHDLALVGDNEAAQKAIKEKHQKKDLELRRKKAQADKTQAIFNANIQGAMAVLQALGSFPPPYSFVMAAIAGAAAGVQIATIAAKPLPAFWKGTDNAPEGYAQIAERGPEIRESQGKMYYYDKPGVAYLNKGDKVYTAQETRAMIDNMSKLDDANNVLSRQAAGNRMMNDIEVGKEQKMKAMFINASPKIDYERMGQVFMKAFSSQPKDVLQIDEKGFKKFQQNKNSKIEYLNKRGR